MKLLPFGHNLFAFSIDHINKRKSDLRREGLGEHVGVGWDLHLGRVLLQRLREVVLGNAHALSVEQLIVDGLGEEIGSLVSHFQLMIEELNLY